MELVQLMLIVIDKRKAALSLLVALCCCCCRCCKLPFSLGVVLWNTPSPTSTTLGRRFATVTAAAAASFASHSALPLQPRRRRHGRIVTESTHRESKSPLATFKIPVMTDRPFSTTKKMKPTAHGEEQQQQQPVQPPLYWSREWVETVAEQEALLQKPVIQPARIVCLTDPNDPANRLLFNNNNNHNDEWTVLQIGMQRPDFDLVALQANNVNAVFVSSGGPLAQDTLAWLIDELPSLRWIQSRNAGIDSIMSSTLQEATTTTTFSEDDDNDSETPVVTQPRILMTNAKGQFSHSLAEYAIMACSYFAKDVPRLQRNQRTKTWDL